MDDTNQNGLLPLIGIVTVLFNSEDVLPGFFASLSKQEGVRYKLYVIDNSPKDAGTEMSRQFAAQYGIDATIKFNDANLGVAKGNNQGIELAQADGCDQILLANNDTEFGAMAIRQLQDVLTIEDESAATPKIMYYDSPGKLWYAGGHINVWLMRTPQYGIGDQDHGQFDTQRYVNYAPTCFMMFNAKVFKKIGLMDEQYFVYYDDTDFIWRMAERGISIRYVPSVRILHKVSSSTGGAESSFSIYFGNRNRVYFIRKNLKGVQKSVALAYMLVTRIPRLLSLRPSMARRGWRGMIDGFQMPLISI